MWKKKRALGSCRSELKGADLLHMMGKIQTIDFIGKGKGKIIFDTLYRMIP